MKRVLSIIRDVLLYFFVALIVAFLAKRFIGSDRSTLELAIMLTVGWAVWQVIIFLFKKSKKNKDIL